MSESRPTRRRKQAFNPGERGWIAGNNYDDSVLDSLESENKRLREALEKYAKIVHVGRFHPWKDFEVCPEPECKEARALRGE